MNLCKTCGTICPFDDERTECDAYAPMTNENWFISLPTEEKAKAIVCLAHNASALAIEYHCSDVEAISVWLKEVHKCEM